MNEIVFALVGNYFTDNWVQDGLFAVQVWTVQEIQH